MDFTVVTDERYASIAHTVNRFGYGRLKRAHKAVVLNFLERVSGYSRQQITRLVKLSGERRQRNTGKKRVWHVARNLVHWLIPKTPVCLSCLLAVQEV